MSDTTTPATDNRFANVAAQHYTDIAIKVIHDEIALAEAETKRFERKHKFVKLGLHIVILAIALALSLAFVASPVILAIVTGAPAFVIEIADIIFH